MFQSCSLYSPLSRLSIVRDFTRRQKSAIGDPSSNSSSSLYVIPSDIPRPEDARWYAWKTRNSAGPMTRDEYESLRAR